MFSLFKIHVVILAHKNNSNTAHVADWLGCIVCIVLLWTQKLEVKCPIIAIFVQCEKLFLCDVFCGDPYIHFEDVACFRMHFFILSSCTNISREVHFGGGGVCVGGGVDISFWQDDIEAFEQHKSMHPVADHRYPGSKVMWISLCLLCRYYFVVAQKQSQRRLLYRAPTNRLQQWSRHSPKVARAAA